MDARTVASCLPSFILKPSLKSFIKIQKTRNKNYFWNEYENTRWKYIYDDIQSLRFFHSAKIRNGCTGREKIPVKYFGNLSGNHDAMIDMGAHMGSISVMLGKLNPEVPLHCFEPVSANVKKLTRNIIENQIDADIHEAVVSSDSGITTFYEKTKQTPKRFGLPGESVSHSTSKKDSPEFETTKKDRIDIISFIEEQGIEKPFLKIDVEGEEHNIMNKLLHDEHSISEFSAIVEIHPDLINEGYGHEIVFWLEQKEINIEWVKTENPRRMALYCSTIG